jgi:AcrR family transcriptional regulator
LAERGPTKRQLQAAATQEQLLDAARIVFAERGYQGATVGAITAAANTAHGTFYLYFRNKQDAFAAVMASVADEIYREADTADPGTDVRSSIESSIRGFLEAYVRHRGLWRSLLEASFVIPEIETVWLAMRGRFVSRIAEGLEQLRDAGLVRDLDIPLVANALGGMVEWTAMTQWVLASQPVPARSIADTACALADLWSTALFADVPSPVRT